MNYKRNYIIKAKNDCILFSLHRKANKNIILQTELNQREKYKSMLEKVDILSNLTPKSI